MKLLVERPGFISCSLIFECKIQGTINIDPVLIGFPFKYIYMKICVAVIDCCLVVFLSSLDMIIGRSMCRCNDHIRVEAYIFHDIYFTT